MNAQLQVEEQGDGIVKYNLSEGYFSLSHDGPEIITVFSSKIPIRENLQFLLRQYADVGVGEYESIFRIKKSTSETEEYFRRGSNLIYALNALELNLEVHEPEFFGRVGGNVFSSNSPHFNLDLKLDQVVQDYKRFYDELRVSDYK